MMEILPLSIGVGLVVSLLFSELFGLVPGGMVVPGYMALYIHRPLDVFATLAAGTLAFAVVRAFSTVSIVYGRRRTALMILVGYLVGTGLRWLLPSLQGPLGEGVDVIGFIIPGLLAIWLDRQGMVETVSALTTVSVVVRLILILIVGPELMQ